MGEGVECIIVYSVLGRVSAVWCACARRWNDPESQPPKSREREMLYDKSPTGRGGGACVMRTCVCRMVCECSCCKCTAAQRTCLTLFVGAARGLSSSGLYARVGRTSRVCLYMCVHECAYVCAYACLGVYAYALWSGIHIALAEREVCIILPFIQNDPNPCCCCCWIILFLKYGIIKSRFEVQWLMLVIDNGA